jgi:hypothetical protein
VNPRGRVNRARAIGLYSTPRNVCLFNLLLSRVYRILNLRERRLALSSPQRAAEAVLQNYRGATGKRPYSENAKGSRRSL